MVSVATISQMHNYHLTPLIDNMKLNEQQSVHLKELLEEILEDKNLSEGYRVITNQILDKLYEYNANN